MTSFNCLFSRIDSGIALFGNVKSHQPDDDSFRGVATRGSHIEVVLITVGQAMEVSQIIFRIFEKIKTVSMMNIIRKVILNLYQKISKISKTWFASFVT